MPAFLAFISANTLNTAWKFIDYFASSKSVIEVNPF